MNNPRLSRRPELATRRLGSSVCCLLTVLVGTLGSAAALQAQAVAPHPPLRILVVSDAVNPHNLPPNELTEPGEVSNALASVVGLRLDSVQPNAILEISTDALDTATPLLALGPDDPSGYDILIYFSHRIPIGLPDNGAAQEAFVDATETFLGAGGSVVSFHHGIYETAGKESMQSLLGGAAVGSVIWNTTEGQTVINVADHFITAYGVTPTGTTSYEDPANAIPLAIYPSYSNIPDERYPNFSFEPDAGDIEILQASNYSASPHVLTYTHHRNDWSGLVIVIQPGEHQPTALAPGNSLQVLLNAIVYGVHFRSGELVFADGFETGNSTLW